MAAVIVPTGQSRNWAELDQAMWNWNPHSLTRGEFYVNPCYDGRMGGNWERQLATPDFAGFCKYIVDFCTDSRRVKNYQPNDGNQYGYGYGFLAYEANDDKIPARPAIRFVGAGTFSTNDLKFTVSRFASPSSGALNAVEWRVAEIAAPGLSGFKPGTRCKYEIEPGWSSGGVREAKQPMQIPANVCRNGHTYRVRARYRDNTGRCSHWSEPIQFVAGSAVAALK
jgi:hypothetical protein